MSETATELARLVTELLGATTACSIGPGSGELAAALADAGWSATRFDPTAVHAADVALSIAVADDETLLAASGHVAMVSGLARRAVVFAPAPTSARSPLWWDELFAAHGLHPVDVLRAPAWDDASWRAATISGLVLYVRDRTGMPQVSPIPRSAVHPGVRAAASTAVEPAADEVAVQQPVVEVVVAPPEDEHERTDEAELRRLQAERDELRIERDDLTAALLQAAPPRRSARRTFSARIGRAVGRRIEQRALAAVDRLSRLPGRAGAVARRSAAVYRSAGSEWIEAARPLVDVEHYLAQRPGLRGAGIDPVVHYFDVGWRQGLDPHPLFETGWYLRANAHLMGEVTNPLEHFVAGGWRAGCDPHPFFDVDHYLARGPDVAIAGVNPLRHYLDFGAVEDRDPHPLFDNGRYRRLRPDIVALGIPPLLHYLEHGWMEGLAPSEIFDAEWYVAEHPEVEGSGLPPWRYYLEVGRDRGDRPSAWADQFDVVEEPVPG